MIWKTLTILVLLAAILGGTGYFVNEYFVKPKKLDLAEQAAPVPVPTPPPDPSLAAFAALEPVIGQDSAESAAAISEFLRNYPESPKAPEARAALGRIHTTLVLSNVPDPGKISYSVVSGDSLVKIASKFKTGAELIYRANGLTTINLKIGQNLMIPQLDTALVIDRERKTVTVLNKGEFFKEYAIQELKLPPAVKSGTVQTKVNDKFAMKGSNRVAFGTKDYDGSDRWIMLGTSGVALRGMPQPGPDGVVPPMPPGIVLSPSDAEELFVLVTRSTPVTIQ